MGEQHYRLRWNNYRTNITAEFDSLREAEHFVDVTLACDGKQLKAHRVVLSACSPYFKELLQGAPCSHPIVILKDIAHFHMRSLLEFMYQGEVNISQAHLTGFLRTAEVLKIRGLAESTDERPDQFGKSNISPVSALKTSLSTLGGIPLGLAPNLLERHGLVPHMLTHTDTPNSQPSLLTHQSQPLHAFSTSGVDVGAVTENQSSGFFHQDKPAAVERRESKSPISLPISKRIRSDKRVMGSGKPSSKNGSIEGVNLSQNGCSTNTFGACSDTVQSTLNVIDSPPDVIVKSEESGEIAPKIEPIDQPMSDTEGSAGYMEEDSGGGLGDPGSPGPFLHNPSTSKNASSDQPENASQILHSIGPESHLQGPLYTDGERLHLIEDQNELRGDLRLSPSSPPLPPSSLPHSCQLCGKLISCRRNLWKHMERVHFTNPAVQCSLCSKMFKNKYALKDHQRIYHGGLSEPMQVAGQASGQQPSLLSRILLDSRQSAEQRSVVEHHQISPRLPPPAYRSRPPEEHEPTPTNYSMGATPLVPSFSGQILPIRGAQSQHGEWTPDEEYALVNRSMFTEVHHTVSKTE